MEGFFILNLKSVFGFIFSLFDLFITHSLDRVSYI